MTAFPPELSDLPELLHVFSELGVTAAFPLASSSPGRAVHCWRLALASGQVVKLRVLRDPARAARYRTLAVLIDPADAPPILSQSGRALVEGWVDGVSLDAPDVEDSRRLGALHARLHAVDLPAAERAYDIGGAWAATLAARLADLVTARLLTAEEAGQLAQVARVSVPTEYRASLIHGDLCPQNVVRTAGGGLCLIDNETLAIDDPGYDLARTWYRWAPPSDRWQAYLASYREQGGRAEDALAHFEHYLTRAVVDGAWFRSRNAVGAAALPVRILREVLLAGRGAREQAWMR